MATPSLILVPSKYKIGTLYTEVATTSAGTVLGSLGDFSVTRASVATRVNSQGFIETIPAVTNLIVQSQNWLASGWRSDATGFTITITGTTGTVDPLGTNTANAISPTSGSATHLKVGSENSASFTSGTVYTSSAFFKQGTGNAGRYVQLTYPASRFTQEGYANFDLQLGTVAVVSGDVAADTNRAASIENYGNGWYRCRLTATCNALGTGNGFSAVLITASGDTRAKPFAGTITDVLYGWGAQTEASSSASPYVATTTAAVTNSIPRIDYYTSSGTVGCPALLVEASGQNLLLRSNELNIGFPWSQDNVGFTTGSTSAFTSPDGTTNAFLMADTSGNTRHRISQQLTTSFVSGTTYTMSIFVKKNSSNRFLLLNANTAFSARAALDLDTLAITNLASSGASIDNYGNGWYRFSIRGTATITQTTTVFIQMQNSASDVDYIGNGSSFYLYGAQVETGSIATSYIPTTTAPVTRNADVINLSGAVSGCISQTEGTFYAEVDVRNLGIETYFLRIDDGGATNVITLRKLNTNQIREAITAPTTSGTINISSSTFTSGILKIAVAYKSGDISLCVNGTNFTANGTFSFSAPFSRISIGSNVTLGSELNDRIRSIAIYTTRLPNEELELLTSPTYYSNVRDLIWGTFAARTSSFSELQSCLQTRHNQLIIV